MSQATVVVLGSTGALGKKLARDVAKRGGAVRAIVRSSSDAEDVRELRELGAEIAEVDTSSVDDLARVCEGSHCVVSTLSGLHPVIVEAQKTLLDATVKAGVGRFFPSDFAIDFYKVPDGTNRNLDLRREFSHFLETAPVEATSILNGVFSEFMFMPTPFVVNPIRRSIYFGRHDQKIDATAMDDASDFTAAAALDEKTPRFLRIAGNVLTPTEIAAEATAAYGKTFKAMRGGTIGILSSMIAAAKLLSFDKSALYPAWQGMQYVRNMQSGEAKLDPLDNDRYDVEWTPLRETLAAGKPDFIG